MHPQKRAFLWINLVGGLAVLGSYVHGLVSNPETRGQLWGGVPEALAPLYTVNMFLAAGGYFLFTYFVFLRLDPDRVRVFGRTGFGAFNAIYAAILVASALWLPLTFAMIESPSGLTWFAVRAVLTTTGVASVALLVAILRVSPHEAPLARRLAVVGCVPFVVQTALLDAIVWPAYYPV
ncbi:MAG: hypothetical protein ACQGVC_19385 [Myxococcota bacterium]